MKTCICDLFKITVVYSSIHVTSSSVSKSRYSPREGTVGHYLNMKGYKKLFLGRTLSSIKKGETISSVVLKTTTSETVDPKDSLFMSLSLWSTECNLYIVIVPLLLGNSKDPMILKPQSLCYHIDLVGLVIYVLI